MVLAALSIVIGANVEAPFLAIGMLSLGAGWLYFTVGAFWSSTTDLSKPHAGTLSGIMNTGANLGGTLLPDPDTLARGPIRLGRGIGNSRLHRLYRGIVLDFYSAR